MKNLLIAFCLFLPFAVFAQLDTSKPAIPMKNGKVWYEATYAGAGNVSGAQVYAKALAWLKATYPEFRNAIITNKADGVIVGKGIFKVPVNVNGNYYWLRPVIYITVKANSYTIQLTDFYEKPIEKGITNDYSKIEYRWWDFRRGHPWSKEDYPLFRGLDDNSKFILTNLHQAIDSSGPKYTL